MLTRRLRTIVRRPGTLVATMGGTVAIVLAAVVSQAAGSIAAIVTIGAAQIIHQDQSVRLLGRLSDRQGETATDLGRLSDRQGETATAVANRFDELAAGVDSAIELLGASSETMSSTMAEHIDELRHRMQQAYRHRERLTSQLQSVASLHSLVDGGAGLPPLREWALMPDSAEAIFRLVREAGADQVVELGSGSSTALLAIEAEQRGAGQVTAVEHDPGYAAQTIGLLSQFGVTSRAEVVTCPLTPIAVDRCRSLSISGRSRGTT